MRQGILVAQTGCSNKGRTRLAVAVCACLALAPASSSSAETEKKAQRSASDQQSTTPAHGAAPIDRAAAKAAYLEGLRAFNLGKWDEAIAAFEKSYKLSGDPALLFNVAQAQRQAGNRREAVIAYKAYLREIPDTPHRELVEARIRELETPIEQAPSGARARTDSIGVDSVDPIGPSTQPIPPGIVEPAEVAPPAASEPSEPPPSAAGPVAGQDFAPPSAPLPVTFPPSAQGTEAMFAQNQSAAAPATHDGSPWRRWWLWTGIGAAVAAGVLTAVLLSTRGPERDSTCPLGVDGCLSVGR